MRCTGVLRKTIKKNNTVTGRLGGVCVILNIEGPFVEMSF